MIVSGIARKERERIVFLERNARLPQPPGDDGDDLHGFRNRQTLRTDV